MSSPSSTNHSVEGPCARKNSSSEMGERRRENKRRVRGVSKQEKETGIHTLTHMYPSFLNILLQLSEWPE